MRYLFIFLLFTTCVLAQNKVSNISYEANFYTSAYNTTNILGLDAGVRMRFQKPLEFSLTYSLLSSKQVNAPTSFPRIEPRFNNWNVKFGCAYVLLKDKKFQIAPEIKVGGGEVYYKDIIGYSPIVGTPVPNPAPIYKKLLRDYYFLFEPTLIFRYRLSPNWQFNFGGGYRLPFGIKDTWKDKDFNSYSLYAGLSFKFYSSE